MEYRTLSQLYLASRFVYDSLKAMPSTDDVIHAFHPDEVTSLPIQSKQY